MYISNSSENGLKQLKDKVSCFGFVKYSIVFLFILVSIAYSVHAAVYAKLSRKIEAGYYLPDNDKIYFVFDEPYLPSTANVDYFIYSHPRSIISQSTLSVHRGTNYLYVNTSGLSSGKYILEVRNSKGEKYFLRFKV